ncbi:MAG: hypothetical protein IJN83_01445 [Clostridia bacterium]|nr:hypothetical protein [Clostridia bacterium]
MIKRFLSIILVILLITGCSAGKPKTAEQLNDTTEMPGEQMGLSEPETTARNDLIIDDEKLYEAADYEEVVIESSGTMEIKPQLPGVEDDTDVSIAYGDILIQSSDFKIYRDTTRTEEATYALLKAMEYDETAWDTDIIRKYAYHMAYGRYAEAEELIAPLWNQGKGAVEAGVLFLLSLVGQDEIPRIQETLANEALYNKLISYMGQGDVYFGGFDENGQRLGIGVGLYKKGYMYMGEYSGGVRSSAGSLYYPNGMFFTGAWRNDLPNGIGILAYDFDTIYQTGTWVNGLEDGEMKKWEWGLVEQGHGHVPLFVYNANNGVPVARVETNDGKLAFAKCEYCEDGFWWTQSYVPLGLLPFTEDYQQEIVSADPFPQG